MAPKNACNDGTWWDGGDQLIEVLEKGLDVSLDLLTCHVDGQKGTFQRSNRLINCSAKEEEEVIIERDYVRLHHEFLESLLQEQKMRQSKDVGKVSAALPQLMEVQSYSITSSSSSSIAPLDTSTTTDLTETRRSTSPAPRRRLMRLPRHSLASTKKSPQKSTRRQVVDVSAMDHTSLKKTVTMDSSSYSMASLLTHNQLASPCTYIHQNCRLQKDKGKGEPIGSDICATGLSPCLEKVRQKMELLTQVALDSKKKSTNMKLRMAKVTEKTGTYTETRSVIELHMGFLSMQYGVLLRWDIYSGKIILVLLRKMVHELFYEKQLVSTRKEPERLPTAYHVHNVVGGKEAILQRDEATEVTLLEPPYRVAKPTDFTPTSLTIAVLKLVGLPTKYHYSVLLTYQGVEQSIRMDHGDDVLKPKLNTDPFELHITPGTVEVDFDVAVEQRRHRTKPKKLLARVKVLVNVLDPHRMHILKLTESCTLIIGVEPQSQFVSWVRSELEARHKEEIFTMKKSKRNTVVEVDKKKPEVEDHIFLDLCCCC